MLGAQKKLEADIAMQAARTEQCRAASPETLEVMVNSIAEAFQRCSPFSEATLLVAFKANPEEVQRIMTKSVKQLLSAPIKTDEFEWFKVWTVLCAMDIHTRVVSVFYSATCFRRRCG